MGKAQATARKRQTSPAASSAPELGSVKVGNLPAMIGRALKSTEADAIIARVQDGFRTQRPWVSSVRSCLSVGEWLSLVAHLGRDQGAGGSNTLSPTSFTTPA